jgi:hypothetical protein
MGLFCSMCAWIYGRGDDVPDLFHQAGCPHEAYGHLHGFDPTEARAALPSGGEWRSVRHIVGTLRVFHAIDGAPGGFDMPPEEEVWAPALISPTDIFPTEMTLRRAYEAGGGKAWLSSPYEKGAVEVRIESPVERADRLGRLWANGAHGEAWPRQPRKSEGA